MLKLLIYLKDSEAKTQAMKQQEMQQQREMQEKQIQSQAEENKLKLEFEAGEAEKIDKKILLLLKLDLQDTDPW